MTLALSGIVASECGYSKEQEQEMQRIREMVTADPGSANRPDSTGITPLHLAVINNYMPLIDWLKDHGADPNSRGPYGDTPLHAAIISDRSPDGKLIRTLLRIGADVNGSNDYGDTPLHRAAHVFDNAAFDAVEVMAHSIDLFLDRLIVHPTPYAGFGGGRGGGRGAGGRGAQGGGQGAGRGPAQN